MRNYAPAPSYRAPPGFSERFRGGYGFGYGGYPGGPRRGLRWPRRLRQERRSRPRPLTGRYMRILLVEDDKDLQRLLKKGLADAGYVVDTAADGEEGHFLGDTEPYDAVILDLGLPKMDGVQVLEKWRKGRQGPCRC